MAKILSQDEIDALLTTVASGDEDIPIDEPEIDHQLRPVVAYDFKHPNRVSKDQIRTMETCMITLPAISEVRCLR